MNFKGANIPEKGTPVVITAPKGFFLEGKTGTMVDFDPETYVATVRLDKPVEKYEQEIPVHVNKLESLEGRFEGFFISKNPMAFHGV